MGTCFCLLCSLVFSEPPSQVAVDQGCCSQALWCCRVLPAPASEASSQKHLWLCLEPSHIQWVQARKAWRW